MKIQFRLSDSNADQYSRHIYTSCITFDEAQIWLACGSYVQFPHVSMFHIGISPKYIALPILPYLISLRCCWIFSPANTTIIWVNFLGQKIKVNKLITHRFIFYTKLYYWVCELYIELNSLYDNIFVLGLNWWHEFYRP